MSSSEHVELAAFSMRSDFIFVSSVPQWNESSNAYLCSHQSIGAKKMFHNPLSLLRNRTKSKSNKSRRKNRVQNGRRLGHESLEKRELMATDLVGVVRGANHYLFNTDPDSSHEMDVSYGLSGDIHVTGNWTGNGASYPGVVRRGSPDGLLHWYLDTDGDPTHEREFAYGLPGDVPVVGNWDRSGGDNIGVVRNGGEGLLHWYLDTDGDPTHEIEYVFGLVGDTPVSGDWNGDGRTDVGVVRAGTDGLLHWYLNTDNDVWQEDEYAFGLPGDTPVVGDWNGDGRDDVGVVRANSNGSLRWHFNTDRDVWAESTFDYGLRGDKPIVGQWRLPEIKLSGNDLVGNSINFGTALTGANVPTRSITISNDGNTTLALSSFSVSNGFQILSTPPTSLAPHASTSLTVGMRTSLPANYSGRLNFRSNDGNELSQSVMLQGKVEIPSPEIELVGVSNGQTISYGTVLKGSTPFTRIFSIRNVGNAPLTVSRPADVSGFAIGWNVPNTILPGRTHAFTVTMSTSAAGSFAGSILIRNNDTDEGWTNFNVSGTIENPSPEIDIVGLVDDVGTTDVGAGPVGSTIARTFTIRNTGTATLAFQSATVPSGFTVTGIPNQLAPNASTQFTVNVDTRTAGTRSGWLRVRSNDADESSFDINLRAQVLAPPTSNYGAVLSYQSITSSSGIMVLKHVRTYGATANNERIYADFYGPSGNRVSSDQRIGDFSYAGLHYQMTASAMSNGNFAAAWVVKKYGGETEIRSAVMDPYGRTVGAVDRRVSISYSQSFASPSIAVTSAGFEVYWVNEANGTRWRRGFNLQGQAITGETLV